MKLARKGEQARERIVAAALTLFSKQGFGETTFQEVSKVSKVQQSGIYYYFKNKEELLQAVVENVITRGRGIIAEKLKTATTSKEKIMKYFAASIEWAEENPEDYQILILLYYYGCVKSEASAVYANVLRVARMRVMDVLAASIQEDKITLPLGLIKTAELLHDALVGGVVNYLSTVKSGMIETRDPEDKWKDYLHLILGAQG